MPDDDSSGRRPGTDGSGGPNLPRTRLAPWMIIPLLVLGLFIFSGQLSGGRADPISYSDFVDAVEAGKIAEGSTVTISDTTISGTIVAEDGERQEFTTSLTPNFQVDQAFTDFLDSNGVEYEFKQPSFLIPLLINILPFALIMFGLYWFVFRRMSAGAGGPLNMGKNKVKIYDRKETEDDLLRRRGRRRGQGGAQRDRGVPFQPEEVPAPGRSDPQGRAAARSPRMRQDAPRSSGGR